MNKDSMHLPMGNAPCIALANNFILNMLSKHFFLAKYQQEFVDRKSC